MKIAESRIRRIIREELLREIAPGIIDPQSSAPVPVGKDSEIDRFAVDTAARQASYMAGDSPRTVLEIALGFTPVGVAIDAGYLAWALYNRDAIGAVLAGIGFIPFFGDAFKGFRKTLESGKKLSPSQIEAVEEAIDTVRATEKPGEAAILEARASASTAESRAAAQSSTSGTSGAARATSSAASKYKPAYTGMYREGVPREVRYVVNADGEQFTVQLLKSDESNPVKINFVAGDQLHGFDSWPQSVDYAKRGSANARLVIDEVLEAIADFRNRFPNEKVFTFSGARMGQPVRPPPLKPDQDWYPTDRDAAFHLLLKQKLRRGLLPGVKSIDYDVVGGAYGKSGQTLITIEHLRRIIAEELTRVIESEEPSE